MVLMCVVALGCDDPDVHNAVQAALYQFLPDGWEPSAQEKAASVLTDGLVDAEIECAGIALGAPGKFVSVAYQASRLQDGACFARVDLTGPAPSGGLAQSSASQLTRRSAPNAASCPVASFHVPQLLSTTTVSGGVIRVESPFCGATPCQMLVSTNCTGLNIDRF